MNVDRPRFYFLFLSERLPIVYSVVENLGPAYLVVSNKKSKAELQAPSYRTLANIARGWAP